MSDPFSRHGWRVYLLFGQPVLFKKAHAFVTHSLLFQKATLNGPAVRSCPPPRLSHLNGQDHKGWPLYRNPSDTMPQLVFVCLQAMWCFFFSFPCAFPQWLVHTVTHFCVIKTFHTCHWKKGISGILASFLTSVTFLLSSSACFVFEEWTLWSMSAFALDWLGQLTKTIWWCQQHAMCHWSFNTTSSWQLQNKVRKHEVLYVYAHRFLNTRWSFTVYTFSTHQIAQWVYYIYQHFSNQLINQNQSSSF